jgi:RHS repeat-associated protein
MMLISREEYTPYGETSFGSFARKRYRYTSKERDEESKLYYHGARYYAPWIGRWTATDPLGLSSAKLPDVSLYAYAANSPLAEVDQTGLQPQPRPAPGSEPRTPPAPGSFEAV